MKDFTKINWDKKDEDDIHEYLFTLDGDFKFDFFKLLCEKYPHLELDWLLAFEEIKDSLYQKEDVEKVLWFVNWYKDKFPVKYLEEYQFIERDLINFFIKKGDWEQVKNRMSIIEQDPVEGIDVVTIRLMYQLIYHGQYQLALDYSNKVLEPIAKSDKLAFSPEEKFATTIYLQKNQEFYKSVLIEEDFDESNLISELVEIGFNEDIILEVIDKLKKPFDIQIAKHSKGMTPELFHSLNIEFLKYMYQKYQSHFMFSNVIFSLFSSKDLFKSEKGRSSFYIEIKRMDEYLVKIYDSIFGTNELEIFGKAWGMIYVFEFFHHIGLYSDDEYQLSLENYYYLRNEFIKIQSQNLWQYNFVFKWPNNPINQDSIELENLFSSTYLKEIDLIKESVYGYVKNIKIPHRISLELKLYKEVNYNVFSPHVNKEPKIERNSPCPCGSGKKYKKCCMND